MTIYTS